MYEITTEPDRKLVRIRITGMLSVEQIADLYREEHQAIRAMGCRIGDHMVLVDLTDCPLQMQDSVAAFQREMNSSAQARRLAIVIGQALGRMQARRIARRQESAFFDNVAKAEAWLFSPSLKDAA